MAVQFNNLYDFFNHIEFCPICKKRLEPALHSTTQFFTENYLPTQLTNKDFTFSHEKSHTINIHNNSLNEKVNEPLNLRFANQCARYHFSYSCNVLLMDNFIQDINLYKYSFIRRKKDCSFNVISNFDYKITDIIITTEASSVKHTMPLVHFNYSSVKNIDNKLRKIQLLL